MENQSSTTPKWPALLFDAVSKPGLIMKAYGSVKRGERALTLCMPISSKRRMDETSDDKTEHAETYTAFIYKPRWFVLAPN